MLSAMQKPPVSKARLRQAILRSVASSTAIETGRSMGSIERKLQQTVELRAGGDRTDRQARQQGKLQADPGISSEGSYERVEPRPAYRSIAERCLERAEIEIAADDADRLKYAALELRMALEALTYDRSYAYADDLPSRAWKDWQPRKFMAALLNLDPGADKDCSLAAVLDSLTG
jgi:hypothetical protein